MEGSRVHSLVGCPGRVFISVALGSQRLAGCLVTEVCGTKGRGSDTVG